MSVREILLAAARGETVRDIEGDGDALVKAAGAEGMVGLLVRSAETVPRALRNQALAVEARAARMVSELARVSAAYETSGVPLLVIKGAVLAQDLYGGAGVRAFSDLDVVVDPAQADEGEAILRRLGYRETEPLSDAQRKINRRFAGESLFVDHVRDGASGVLVDFHWRFSHVQFPLRLSFAEAWQRRRCLVVDGHTFATLGETDLAVVTCSHAAKHLWHRLELLAQIVALTRREIDWSAVDRLAVATGTARQTGLSFLLAREILGITPPQIPRSLAAAEPLLGRVRNIVEANLFAEVRRVDARGRDLFLLLDRRSDALRSLLLAALVPTHSDWHGSRLPAAMQWVVRPFRLLGKRLRRKDQF
jgi:hypothetical protein